MIQPNCIANMCCAGGVYFLFEAVAVYHSFKLLVWHASEWLSNTSSPTFSELLRKARMLLSTEFGKDALLRMRKLFKEEARVTVEPTERGITKIDGSHPYFVSCYCAFRPDSKLIRSRIPNISIRSRSTIC
jgi:hypothetical protein